MRNSRMISFRILLAFTFSAKALAIESPQPQETYQHSRKLSEHMHLYWNFTDISITFEVHGRTTGWIGIGFSSKGNMVGADIVVGWVDGSGSAVITDRHGPSSTNGFPPLDPEQSLTSTSGREIDGWTIITFTRERAACDEVYDSPLNEGTQRIIWAIGQSDPRRGGKLSAEDRHTHSDRGSISVYLFQDNNAFHEKNFSGPAYKTFDVTVKNLTLPSINTYYNCRITKLPTLNVTHHIVKMEPVIQQANTRNVHHMLLYLCPSSWTPGGAWQEESDVNCVASRLQRRPCTHLFMGWAVGGLAAILPDETGIPIGDNGGAVSSYVLLETHYDNADGQEGIIDSSGMRFTYTPNLRKYDTGIFPIGQLVSGLHHYIPPGAKSFTTKTPCVSECVNSVLESATIPNITLHHVILHSHLAGRKMKLRHFRNGRELPYVMYDEAYDFDYQEYIGLDPYVTVLPGDEFQMECTYNSEDRDYVTQGGLGTHEEMCLAYISYYPAVYWDGCVSYTDAEDSLQYFGISKYEPNGIHSPWSLSGYNVSTPSSLSGKTLLDVVSEHNWTQEQIREFEKYFHEKSKTHICARTPREFSEVSIIETNFSYVPPTHTCGATVSAMSLALIAASSMICGIFTFT